jgi:hypothetical protein
MSRHETREEVEPLLHLDAVAFAPHLYSLGIIEGHATVGFRYFDHLAGLPLADDTNLDAPLVTGISRKGTGGLDLHCPTRTYRDCSVGARGGANVRNLMR